jgi:DNA-binding SARP family transcriptional activator/tetratricopeptide (TPR) repeat protein
MTTGSPARWLLLGAPCVLVPGPHESGRIEIPETAPAYLALYLATRRGWAAREHLAALLWPELQQARGLTNLRVALNRLGALLAQWGLSEALVAERRRVKLDVASDLAEAEAASAAGRWAAAAALHGGPLLQGMQFTPYPALAEWLQLEREAVRRAWRKALIEAAAAPAEPASVTLFERYLAAHPADGGVVALHATRLAASGRAPEAAEQLAAFRAAAADELPAQDIESTVQEVERAMAGIAAGSSDRTAQPALVGREAELAELGAALRQHRWVTIVGWPGVGKSALAAAWVETQGEAQDKASRQAIVQAQVHEHAAADAVSRLLHARLGAGGPLPRHGTALAEALTRLQGRVVLDGLDAAAGDPAWAALSHTLATACPGLQVLATARAPLAVPGEHVLRLGGLGTGPSADGSPGAAVQMLLRETGHQPAGRRWSAADADVARVARLAGGLPLALRLAASWSRWLGPRAVAEEIERAGPGLAAPLMAWLPPLLARLAEHEQQAFATLSLFPRDFDLTAAAAVAATTATTIERLAEQGLIDVRAQRATTPTLGLHPLLRAFAQARLAQAPALRRQAIERYLAWVERCLLVRRSEYGQPVIRAEQIEPWIDEVRAAWPLALQTGAAAAMPVLVQALLTWYESVGDPGQGAQHLQAALQAFDDSVPAEAPVLARVQAARATLLYRASDYDAAEPLALQASRLAAATGQRRMERMALNVLGLARWMLMRLDEAQAAFAEGLQSAVDDGEARGEAIFAGNLALVAKSRGDYGAAEAALRRVIEINRASSEWWGASTTLNSLANLLRHLGRLPECEAAAQECLRLTHEHRLATARPYALVGLAQLRQAQGRGEEALAYLALIEACEPGSVEGPVQAGVAQVRAVLALESGNAGQALAHIVHAVRLALASDDVMNRAEALALYGRWLDGPGRDAALARALWSTLWHAASTHAVLRDEIEAQLAARGETLPPVARSDVDLVLLAEQLVAVDPATR